MFSLSKLANDRSNRLVIASAAMFEAKATISLFEKKNIPFTYIEIGIGAIQASAMSKSLSPLVEGRHVLFLGSCGTSATFNSPYLVQAESVHWSPGDVRRGQGYLVPNAEPSIQLRSLSAQRIDSVEIVCSSSIALLSEDKPDIYENLELYSVARNWMPLAETMTAVLGVTNHIGPHAHSEWVKNFKDVAFQTSNYFEQLLS
ncbi:MAG: hypothetical protein NT027_17725 [Proteobacteria bacterium]|nr:hypothetical protein [Pseudomonadota bacterium]